MSRLANLVKAVTLVNYAQGAAQKATSSISEFLAPTVNVGSPVFYYKKYSNKHRYRILDTRRPLLGRAVELRGDAENVLCELTPHAIDAPVDRIEMLSDSELGSSLMTAADTVAMQAALGHEQEVCNMALTAAGAGTDHNFTSDSVDPIKILDAALLTIARKMGVGSFAALRMVFGPTAWERYKNNAKVRAAFVGGSGGKGKASTEGGASLVTPALENVTALQLGTPEARMSMMVYNDAQEGLAQDNKWLLDDGILIFGALANPTVDDPSAFKTFRQRDQWMVPGSYMREDGRVEVAKMDWMAKPVATNTEVVIRINAKAA